MGLHSGCVGGPTATPHLCHPPGVHVVPAAILNHLLGQVYVDALVIKHKRSEVILIQATAHNPSEALVICLDIGSGRAVGQESLNARVCVCVPHLLIFAVIPPELLDVYHGIDTAPLVHPPHRCDPLVFRI